MGTKKISELTETSSLNDNDILPVVDITNETTKKVTMQNLSKKVYTLVPKSYTSSYDVSNTAITNNTTTFATFGSAKTITTTGKPLVIIASTVGSVNGGNLNVRMKIDSTHTDVFMTTNSSTRERMVGNTILNNLSAGQHTFQLEFACSQSDKVASIHPYINTSFSIFEI